MHVAVADLGLHDLTVLHPGPDTFPLADRIRAVGLPDLVRAIAPLRADPA